MSRGKIVCLSDLKPESFAYTPYFPLDKELPSRQEFFRPADRTMESKPLRLGGLQFSRGWPCTAAPRPSTICPADFSAFRRH